jgi:hypothetical protein
MSIKLITGKGVCSYYTLLLSLKSVAYRVAQKGIFPSKPDRQFGRVRARLMRWFQLLKEDRTGDKSNDRKENLSGTGGSNVAAGPFTSQGG